MVLSDLTHNATVEPGPKSIWSESSLDMCFWNRTKDNPLPSSHAKNLLGTFKELSTDLEDWRVGVKRGKSCVPKFKAVAGSKIL